MKLNIATVLLLTLSAFVSTYSGFAQIAKNSKQDFLELTNQPSTQAEADDYYYLIGEWMPGRISMHGGMAMDVKKMRYDLDLQQVEIMRVEEEYGGIEVFNLWDIDSLVFKFDNNLSSVKYKRYVSGSTFRVEGIPLVGLFEIVSEGPYQLYAKAGIEFKNKPQKTIKKNKNKEEEVSIRHEIKKIFYYFGNGTRNLQPVDVDNKDMLSYFDKHEKRIATYIKKNRFSLNRRRDLIKIVDFANGLSK
ncbi:hypothetical protein V6R21_08835 [Limibacter armeniacum]|uniref:hypothetical protein n=1 Tax=Limibacter armeniacum TaxID=466084 RepID=UPI002FE5A050